MRRTLYLILPAVLLCLQAAHGQKINEDVVKIGKDDAKGFVATSEYSKTQVDEALAAELERIGLKKHGKSKKFYTFKGAECAALCPTKVDIYYKVQKKKHHSKIYFVASKGYDNYITSASDAAVATNINTFLGGIDAVVAHNEDVKQKEAELAMANEKLAKEKADMQKAEQDKKNKEKELRSIQSDK